MDTRRRSSIVRQTETRASIRLQNNVILDLLDGASFSDDADTNEGSTFDADNEQASWGPELVDEEMEDELSSAEKEKDTITLLKEAQKGEETSLEMVMSMSMFPSETPAKAGESPMADYSSEKQQSKPSTSQPFKHGATVDEMRSSQGTGWSTGDSALSETRLRHSCTLRGESSSLVGAFAMRGSSRTSSEEMGSETPVVANAVAVLDGDRATDLEALRVQIYNEAVQADAVEVIKDNDGNGTSGGVVYQHDHRRNVNGEQRTCRQRQRICLIVVGAILLIVALSVGVSVALRGSSSSDEPLDADAALSKSTTLEVVQERGRLICGAYFPADGLTALDENGTMQGLLADICRAVAAVVLDDAEKVEFVRVGPFDRFMMLQNRTIDIVTEPEKRFRDLGYDKPVSVTQHVLSREPLALVTRDLDSEWSDIVNSVMDILFAAEGYNITQKSAQQYNQSGGELSVQSILRNVDSHLVRDRLLKIVAAVGNYGEIYNRSLQVSLPRGGINQLNKVGDRTGLLYNFPFGYNLDVLDTSRQPAEKISALRARGMLRCGVFERPNFAELNHPTQGWHGFDVEFCKGLAAALFRTEEGSLEIVSLGFDESSMGFESLLDGSVDVVAGQRISLTNKYQEAATGVSFSFSPPCFYGENPNEVRGLATARNDTNWSDFVYWVVMGLIYAEEMGITSTTSTTEMPIVNVYGDDLKRMFFDCVSRVGNYGDIYERTLGNEVPRSGRNLLNDLGDGAGPQQIALPIV